MAIQAVSVDPVVLPEATVRISIDSGKINTDTLPSTSNSSNIRNEDSFPWRTNSGLFRNASQDSTSKLLQDMNAYRIRSKAKLSGKDLSGQPISSPLEMTEMAETTKNKLHTRGIKSYSSTDLSSSIGHKRPTIKDFKSPSFSVDLLNSRRNYLAQRALTSRDSTSAKRGYNETGTIIIPKAYEKTELAKKKFDKDDDASTKPKRPSSSKHRFSKTGSFVKEARHRPSEKYVIPGQKVQEGHHNYILAYNMITGIRVAVSRRSQIPKPLTNKDYREVSKIVFNWEGGAKTPFSKYEFKFKDYAPEVFRHLRSIFHVDQADYLLSLTEKVALTELGSPGKSGSFFYYSRDYRFIIKTIHYSEYRHLRRILKQYHDYVMENPGTLLCQFYGLHRLKMHTKHGLVQLHFVVMNNIFPPTSQIHERFDLKGSTCGRYTDIAKATEEQKTSLCLKDLNFLRSNTKIHLGPEMKTAVLEQLRKDVKFLEATNTMDYSLLLGVHKMSDEEMNTPVSQNPPFLSTRDVSSSKIFSLPDGGIRAADESGKELPIVYYMAIIDCLTNYSTRKRLETFFRSMKHKKSTISAISPVAYGKRFYLFMKAGMTHSKEFKT